MEKTVNILNDSNINDNNILKLYIRNRQHSLIKFITKPDYYLKFKEKWRSYLSRLSEYTKKSQKDALYAEDRLKEKMNSIKIKDNSINDEKIMKNNDNVNLNSNINKTSNSNKTKSFIVTGKYPDIKQSLRKRGWVENSNSETINFDFKWSLNVKEIPAGSQLKINQIVNHFIKNCEMTTKSGLAKNLRNLILRNIDIDNFYPRSYELSERNEFEDFLDNFKTTKALGLLKQFFNDKRQLKENVLKTVIDICERKISNIEKVEVLGISSNSREFENLISDSEWFLISEEENNLDKEVKKLEKMHKIGMVYSKNNISSTRIENESSEKNIIINPNSALIDIDLHPDYKEQVSKILDKLAKLDPQYLLNGHKNIWILKPIGLSRGRGIQCSTTLNEIFTLIKQTNNHYIAQKYIENPLVILDRKFDIRQWVLVTDLNPLTIWLWDTPYLRFGAEDYNAEEITNLFSHLTNNSIVKNSKFFENNKIEGNMWSCEEFSSYLYSKYGEDVWKFNIQEKIKKIIICSLDAVKNSIINRKNSFELFGFDIMVDDKLNTWLIEVNSSPCMEYSTPVTEKLVKLMAEDLIKVVLDYPSASENERSHVDTGGFIKICDGKYSKVDFIN